jgi:MFS family permease
MADQKLQVIDPHIQALDEHDGDRKLSQVDDIAVAKITKVSSIFMVLISGLALFSDGYNAQIIGYMNPLFKQLYPDAFSPSIKTRLSNAYLIGEIFGMLFFGFLIDKMGRRTGIFFATLFLVLGIILATAAHGNSHLGMFWMMIVGRGVAGFGAGGEHIKLEPWMRC